MKALPTLLIVAALGLSSCFVSQKPLQTSAAAKAPEWSTTPGLSTDFINSVAVSADGNRVLGGTYYYTYESWQDPKLKWGTFGTYCYDRKGALLWKDEYTGYVGVYWVDISKDGASAISGGMFSDKPYQGFVRLYDAKAGKVLNHFPTKARTNIVLISDDGNTAIAAADTLMLFTRSGSGYVKSDEFDPTAKGDSVYTADISGDGKRVVCGTVKSGVITVFDVANGKLSKLVEWTLPDYDDKDSEVPYSHCIRMTPSGTSFATGGDAGHFYLLDVDVLIKTGKPSVTWAFPSKGAIYSVAVSDDASMMVGLANAADKSGIACGVTRKDGEAKQAWTPFKITRNPNRAQINLQKGMIAIADGHPLGTKGNFYLLDAATGIQRWQFTTDNMSWPIVISKDGSAIVGGSDDSKVYFFTP